MKASLVLVAALLLSAIVPPSDAHAGTCPSWDLFSSYAYSQAKAGFSPALSCTVSGNQPPVDGCGHGGSVQTTVLNCTSNGAQWIMTRNSTCLTGPMRIYTVVRYAPSPSFAFTEVCTCSEGNSSCAWQ